jgi:hypothetical protein
LNVTTAAIYAHASTSQSSHTTLLTCKLPHGTHAAAPTRLLSALVRGATRGLSASSLCAGVRRACDAAASSDGAGARRCAGGLAGAPAAASSGRCARGNSDSFDTVAGTNAGVRAGFEVCAAVNVAVGIGGGAICGGRRCQRGESVSARLLAGALGFG